ncbi:hypothetical protein [Bradyrhizobium sp. USDA 4473]
MIVVVRRTGAVVQSRLPKGATLSVALVLNDARASFQGRRAAGKYLLQCNLGHMHPTFSTALSGRQFWWDAMDDEFCRERARIVRELAEQADPFIKKRLLQLAANYERRIDRPERAERDRADLLACRPPIRPS